MSSSSTLYFQLHQTAEAFIRSDCYDEQAKAAYTFATTLAPNCEYHVCPTTIHEPFLIKKSPMSIKEVEELGTKAFKFLRSYNVEAKDITVDEIQRKAVVHAVLNVAMKAEFGEDNCSLDAIFTLWMSQDGTVIEKVHQFVDSLSATKFYEEQKWVSRRTEECDPG